MTDAPTSPPPDHAPQPPLAEGERELSDAEEALGCIRAFPSNIGEVEGRITEKGARLLDRATDIISVALAQMTRERDAAVAREARLREALTKIVNIWITPIAPDADVNTPLDMARIARAALASTSTSEAEGGA